MDLKLLMDNIGLSGNAKEIIMRHDFSDEKINELSAEFYNDTEKFFIKYNPDNNSELYLSLFTRMAVKIYPDFIKKGYSDEIYFDTFSDLRIWNENCIVEIGVCGLREVKWLANHLKLQIVKLKRLQYQSSYFKDTYETGGKVYKKGDEAYSIHIPRGEPLTTESCEESFETAKKIFKGSIICRCDSWLLSPVLKNFLDVNSNIIKFQNQFSIVNIDYSNRSGERFLFGKIGNPEEYVAVTTLQKKLLEYIKSGKTVGAATGIKVLRE